MKTLRLEKRGCDFWNDEKVKSDINNYRVCTEKENIEGKNGKTYFLEFSLWRNRGHYRKTYKNNTAKILKTPVWVVDCNNAMYVDTQFTEKNNGSFSDIKLEEELNSMGLTYTQENILKIVNIISKNEYNKIKFI